MILKILLRPLDKFFFGGEQNFKEQAKAETRRTSYILKSRYFPQQTGVLGLIRNQLLLQSGLLKDNSSRVINPDAAKVLIGEKSFRLGGGSNSFGVIKRLSPIFLATSDGQICLPAPLDDIQMPQRKNDGGYVYKNMSFQVKDNMPVLENFREKTGLSSQFQHHAHGNESLESLFQTDKRVGITKSVRAWGNAVTGQQDEAGYYYQHFKRFRSEPKSNKTPLSFYTSQFCFYVELEDKLSHNNYHFSWVDRAVKLGEQGAFTLQSGIVEFGGERSTFYLEVKQQDEKDWTLPTLSYQHTHLAETMKNQVSRLICISPSFISDLEKLRKLTLFRATKAITFRFLKSNIISTQQFNELESYSKKNKSSSSKKLVESRLFHLFDRGSVFYFKKVDQAQLEQLIKHSSFQKIGYNQYQII